MLHLPHETRALQYLARRCRQWGGELIHLSNYDFQEWIDGKDEAPFTSRDLGIDWKRKQIAYASPVSWPDVVHEMGHVFACRVDPWHSRCNEWKFFGWEYCLAALVAKRTDELLDAWFKGNAYYVVGARDKILRDLTWTSRDSLMLERIEVAKQAGLIHRGQPQSVRV